MPQVQSTDHVPDEGVTFVESIKPEDYTRVPLIDTTSDSCAVFFSCGPEVAEELGWSIAGAAIENAGDGYCYAMVGSAWDDSLTDAENDAEWMHCRGTVVRELNAAGIYCNEEPG